jgi:hypothetical protein
MDVVRVITKILLIVSTKLKRIFHFFSVMQRNPRTEGLLDIRNTGGSDPRSHRLQDSFIMYTVVQAFYPRIYSCNSAFRVLCQVRRRHANYRSGLSTFYQCWRNDDRLAIELSNSSITMPSGVSHQSTSLSQTGVRTLITTQKF